MRRPVSFGCRFLFTSAALLVGSALASGTQPAFLRLEAEDGAVSGATIRDDQNGASGGRCGFIDGTPQSITWDEVLLRPGRYRVTLGCKSPWGTEEAKKRVRVALNDEVVAVELPNTAYFSSVVVGDFDLPQTSRVVVSDDWSWYFIDWIQFARIEAAADDRGATRAQRMLGYLVANQLRGGGIVSGQQNAAEMDYIREKSGQLPAIVCQDFGDYDAVSLANWGEPPQTSEQLIAHWENGHFVSVSWHWHSPSGWREEGEDHWWNSFYTANTSFNLASALAEPDGTDYALLLADIDRIALELQKLADANVPVLWRPLHEAEGNAWGAWFWWGASGPEAFKVLWHLLYDRLVNHHQLHNLVWVYSCTDQMDFAWYPGDEYVDVVGVDEYPDDRSTDLKDAWERMNATFGGTGKPIALSECAAVPEVEAMRAAGVNWLYFNTWDGTFGPTSMPEERLAFLYQSGALRSLGEIDQNADGVANGVCFLRGIPTQIQLSPEFGLDTGQGVAAVDLGPALATPGTVRGNLLELDPTGTWVSLGTSFRCEVSANLLDWAMIQPSNVAEGAEGRIRIVFAAPTGWSAFLRCEMRAVP